MTSSLLIETKPFISIMGLIGAGKSTLAEGLGKSLDLPVYKEKIKENKYLQKFYENPKEWSFLLQISLLTARYRQHKQVTWDERGGVQDRTMFEDAIFARVLFESGNMTNEQFEVYVETFNTMSNDMRKPTFVLFLRVSPETAMKRIKARNREMEKTITLDYMRKLHRAYDDFLSELRKEVAIVEIDWNDFKRPAAVANAVRVELNRIRSIRKIHI